MSFKRIPAEEALKKIEEIYRARISAQSKEVLVEIAVRREMSRAEDLPIYQLSNLMSCLDSNFGVIRTDLGDKE